MLCHDMLSKNLNDIDSKIPKPAETTYTMV